MKRFWIKLLKLAGLVGILSVLIFLTVFFALPKAYAKSYQKGFVYQYRALQKADLEEPKILVIGDSSMAFSVDSERLSEKMEMPAYTLGIHAGMGMSYNLETAEQFIHENDIVLLYFKKCKKEDYGLELIYMTLEGEPDLFRTFWTNHPLQGLKGAGSAVTTKLFNMAEDAVSKVFRIKSDDSVYQAGAFEPETGNLIYKRDRCIAEENTLYLNERYEIESVEKECFDMMNAFADLCDEKGARLYLVQPPIYEKAVASTEQEIAVYERGIEENLKAPFLVNIRESMVPEEYLYDVARHLNDTGKRYYTDMLAESLKTALKK